jgi:hypothetical protein
MTSSCTLSIKSISTVEGVLLMTSEEVINKTPTADEIDLVEREQEEVINKTPIADEIDLVEREQEEVINKTPTTDEIDLLEREQEEFINKTPTTDEIDLVEREQEEVIHNCFPCSPNFLAYMHNQEEFEDTKRVIRIRKLMEDGQHNDKKKKHRRTNNDL